jgi:TusA-related sulfurtransferase
MPGIFLSQVRGPEEIWQHTKKMLATGTRRESMTKLINAEGLGCAEPVILAKQALELYDEIIVIVNERTALENLRALGMHAGCVVNVVEILGGTCSVHFRKEIRGNIWP